MNFSEEQKQAIENRGCQFNVSASERWERVCTKYRESALLNTALQVIGGKTGLDWYASRGSDTPAMYVSLTLEELLKQNSFGIRKAERLLELLEAGAKAFHLSDSTNESGASEPEKLRELTDWDHFPLELCGFSQRLLNLCSVWEVNNPKDLCLLYERRGPDALRKYSNSGKKTVGEIESVYRAWTEHDLVALQQLIPLDSAWRFTLEIAVMLRFSSLSVDQQKALACRLVDKQTLEAAAKQIGVTRERVRQGESKFLTHVQKCLNYFSETKALLFEAWANHLEMPLTSDCQTALEPLLRGAISACFEFSDDGIKQVLRDDDQINKLIDQIREDWRYYSGKLDLKEYLAGHAAASLLPDIEKEGISRGFWEMKAGKLVPLQVSPKRASLVALKLFPHRKVSTEEWLTKLKECERFRDFDLAKLQRSYSSWQFDSSFACRQVQFGSFGSALEIEGISGTSEATENRTGKRITQTFAISPEHQALESILVMKIQQAQQLSADDTLLGFLDVEQTTQQEVLALLREQTPKLSPSGMFKYFPATTAYGLSVAAAIGLQDEEVGGAAFYKAWEAAFGYLPPQLGRKTLATAFQSVLGGLGLPVGTIFPEHEPDWHGGCYLFHAAILPHFIKPLEHALVAAQRVRALPDLEDNDQVESFSKYLAGRVSSNQKRLIKVLESEVGSLLVRRLVRWHLTGEDSLFPAHIKSLVGRQKSSSVQVVQSPYVQFDEESECMRLVLPVQSESIADFKSRWVIGDLVVRAVVERRPIPILDLPAVNGIIEVKLQELKEGRHDVLYNIEQGFDARPFRIFEAKSGRERRFPPATTFIEVPAGKGCVVVLAKGGTGEVRVDSDHQVEEVGQHQIIRFDSKVSSPPLLLSSESNDWAIRAKVRPGLYLHRDDANTFNAFNERSGRTLTVIYGHSFGLAVCLPEGIREAEISFQTSVQNLPMHCISIQNERANAGMQVKDLDEDLRQWLATLPAAVHHITLILSSQGRANTLEWFYWKGLERITLLGDLACTESPVNLKSITGFTQNGGRLDRKKGDGRRGFITLTNIKLDEEESWEIPDNRVLVSLLDGQGNATDLNQGASVEVLPDDPRVVQFRHGGLLPLHLKCGAARFGLLGPDRPVISRYLSALAIEYGKTGTLTAEVTVEVVGQKPWEVLQWRTPQTASECLFEEGENTLCSWWVCQIPINGLEKVRLQLTNLRNLLTEGRQPTKTALLNIPNGSGELVKQDLGEPLNAIVRQSAVMESSAMKTEPSEGRFFDIGLSFDKTILQDDVWAVDVECLLTGSSTWQTITCLETHDRLADVRFILIGGVDGKEATDSRINKILGDDLERSLSASRWLVNWKYPTVVWKAHQQFLRGLYHRLCQSEYESNCGRMIWWHHAVADLNAHSERLNSVVAPCLLITSNLKMATIHLKGCDPGRFDGKAIILRAFREATVFENRAASDDLSYVQSLFHTKRLDFDFLQFFAGWKSMLQGQSLTLGRFQYRDWNEYLRKECSDQTLSSLYKPEELLSQKHFVLCLGTALKRCESLLGVLQRDGLHWLSPNIAQLRNASDRANIIIQQVLGERLGTLPEVFWRPLVENPYLIRSFNQSRKLAGAGRELTEQRKELLQNVMQSACLFALLLRTQEYEPETNSYWADLLGKDPERQASLVLGTAPELFSFYYLLFTLTFSIRPTI